MDIWVCHSTLLPSKKRHDAKSHHENRFSPTAAVSEYLIEHALGQSCSSNLVLAEYGCMSVSFNSSAFQESHDAKSHPETRFSSTAAPPKYLIELAIGWYCLSDIAQEEYRCMSVSLKSPFFRLGPKSAKRSKVIIQLGFLPLRHHQSTWSNMP